MVAGRTRLKGLAAVLLAACGSSTPAPPPPPPAPPAPVEQRMETFTANGYELTGAEYWPYVGANDIDYPKDVLWGFYPQKGVVPPGETEPNADSASAAAVACARESWDALRAFVAKNDPRFRTINDYGAANGTMVPRFYLWTNDYSQAATPFAPGVRESRLWWWARKNPEAGKPPGYWKWEASLTQDGACHVPQQAQIDALLDDTVANLGVGSDPSSDSNPQDIAVKHASFDLTVDLTKRELHGIAKLTVERRHPKAKEIRLDVGSLEIASVTPCDATDALATSTKPSTLHSPSGKTLRVVVPASDCIAITYATPTDTDAFLWLDASLTAGKKQPMLFTESEPTFARTWLPLQDTPGVRFTYDATVHVPPGVMALMSATNPQQRSKDNTYRFTMDKPIPSYLVALAVGDFAFKSLGSRTGVYTEPATIKAAAYEFAEVEKMIAAAEKQYGPYRWGRYDFLVLPPAFPLGGMENPMLTFLTPTVLTGDRSLVGLLAHELAHSWSGNLVTNSTWNDVWLNEGITTYVERRIMEALRGTDVSDMDWATGRSDLEKVVADPKNDTRLSLTIKRGQDPDDVPSSVAYEKGALLMRSMELAFGRERFDAFLRRRFDRLAFTSSDSATFEQDVAAELDPEGTFPLAAWLHENGIPKSAAPTPSTRVDALRTQAVAFQTKSTLPTTKGWTSAEWTTFLQIVLESSTPEQLHSLQTPLRALAKQHKLTGTTNLMIAMRWYVLAINADLEEVAPAVEAYTQKVGRSWLVGAVYRAMVRTKAPFWQKLAQDSYAHAKGHYHAMTRAPIEQVLKEIR
ncbi:MAG TPA: leukotriene A4 hydrolase C-terminal domain-containing protein [Kofleriaceae bacterium]